MDVIINANLPVAPENSQPLIQPGNFYQQILSCLGYVADSPPVADLLRLYHGLEGKWLIASPMYWQATHNDAMIVACGDELELSDETSRSLFAIFAEFIAADTMHAYYHNATTWLLNCDAKPTLTAIPVNSLLQQSLMPQLQKLDPTFFWQRFFTECQMLFNANQYSRNQPDNPINGLWFWGQGVLDPIELMPLISDDCTVALASILSTNVQVYQPAQRYAKNSVFIFNELPADELQHLQTQLQQFTVRWHWNNLAYTSKPASWLSRIWR